MAEAALAAVAGALVAMMKKENGEPKLYISC